MKKLSFLTPAVLIALAAPAGAAEKTGGYLSYTEPAASKHDNNAMRKMIYNTPKKKEETQTEAAKTGDAPENATPTSKVWKKYKSLAAGTPEPEEVEKPEKPAKPEAEKPSPVKTQTSEPTIQNNAGLAAIIERYRQSQKERKQMRSLTISGPDDKK